ncbi:hypothetical protein AQUCO_02200073v1 [Aquilegia coerulea]|uniref:non-specific serine/threonine protein kinase n=1 Tax=Aquilegia coerulea TaxID=218851 RepID=A0A2G5DD47_AQUCA|nr:hypothetical protein AQUCO_02200073v1 [Aquilegia coerulea]
MTTPSWKQMTRGVFVGLKREEPNRYNTEQLQVITSDYSKHLGSGSFGHVYKGILDDGREVAVKVLKNTTLSATNDQFKAEVSTLCNHHQNLVKLYGFCSESDKKALVYEFMENGSLDNILYGNQSIKFEMLWKIAIGTANGLSYLHHSCQPSIIHYDIKPANILLDANFYPKIGDFGLAKLLEKDTTHVTVSNFRGTGKYAAPELSLPWVSDLKGTHKSDVYSYGKLLYELCYRCLGQDWWDRFENGQEEWLMNSCGIEGQDREKVKRIFKTANECMTFKPQLRPSMSDVVTLLEGTELGMPIDSSSATVIASFTSHNMQAASSSSIAHNRIELAILSLKMHCRLLKLTKRQKWCKSHPFIFIYNNE